MNILVTGGAGFIGSSVVRYLIHDTPHRVLNLDKLTYAGNLESVTSVADHPRYRFVRGDICDSALVSTLLGEFRPNVVMHLAAESHVDRSIDGAGEFVRTNIVGTYELLEAARRYWSSLPASPGQRATDPCRPSFRFHHISTDEVYGSLGSDGLFSEATAYDPSSPYAASKASSDHLVRAWHRTYGLPVVITNCSNNYGPYQFPEKLIPLVILNALEGKSLPVYGDGRQVRDWLHVEDHARALFEVATRGKVGETYNIGGHNEKTNLEVVETLCDLLEELHPPQAEEAAGHRIARVGLPANQASAASRYYRDLITFVLDRPGHDQRYAIDAGKIQRELGWSPRETFATGLRKTVQWYLENLDWCHRIQQGCYQRERLGLGAAPARQTAQ